MKMQISAPLKKSLVLTALLSSLSMICHADGSAIPGSDTGNKPTSAPAVPASAGITPASVPPSYVTHIGYSGKLPVPITQLMDGTHFTFKNIPQAIQKEILDRLTANGWNLADSADSAKQNILVIAPYRSHNSATGDALVDTHAKNLDEVIASSVDMASVAPDNVSPGTPDASGLPFAPKEPVTPLLDPNLASSDVQLTGLAQSMGAANAGVASVAVYAATALANAVVGGIKQAASSDSVDTNPQHFHESTLYFLFIKQPSQSGGFFHPPTFWRFYVVADRNTLSGPGNPASLVQVTTNGLIDALSGNTSTIGNKTTPAPANAATSTAPSASAASTDAVTTKPTDSK